MKVKVNGEMVLGIVSAVVSVAGVVLPIVENQLSGKFEDRRLEKLIDQRMERHEQNCSARNRES